MDMPKVQQLAAITVQQFSYYKRLQKFVVDHVFYALLKVYGISMIEEKVYSSSFIKCMCLECTKVKTSCNIYLHLPVCIGLACCFTDSGGSCVKKEIKMQTKWHGLKHKIIKGMLLFIRQLMVCFALG